MSGGEVGIVGGEVGIVGGEVGIVGRGGGDSWAEVMCLPREIRGGAVEKW